MSGLLAVVSWILPAAASAAGPGRCYPPPCAVSPAGPVAETATLGAGPVLVGPSSGSSDESPLPDVLIGLFAVVGSLTVVGLRRRMHIARRTAPGPSPSPVPSGQAPVRQSPRVSLR